jgi:hypothetical protein
MLTAHAGRLLKGSGLFCYQGRSEQEQGKKWGSFDQGRSKQDPIEELM